MSKLIEKQDFINLINKLETTNILDVGYTKTIPNNDNSNINFVEYDSAYFKPNGSEDKNNFSINVNNFFTTQTNPSNFILSKEKISYNDFYGILREFSIYPTFTFNMVKDSKDKTNYNDRKKYQPYNLKSLTRPLTGLILWSSYQNTINEINRLTTGFSCYSNCWNVCHSNCNCQCHSNCRSNDGCSDYK